MGARQEQGPVPGDLALETVGEWLLWLTEVERWLLPHVARREARHHAWAYIRGLLSPVERKNGWQLAEVNGDATPLVSSICWGGHAEMQTPSVMICVPIWSSP